MKIFGFKTSNEKGFVHVISNLIIFGVVALIGAVSFLFVPSIMAGSFDNDIAIYRGNSNKKNISLMFSIYWGNEAIIPILNILKENNIKATFFVGGSWAEDNQNLLQSIYNDGHELGNHGYYNKDLSKLDLAQKQNEIHLNHNLIKNLLNHEMDLFMPPFCNLNQDTLKAAKLLKYKTIMYSKDVLNLTEKSQIISRITTNLQNGDLILLSPTTVITQTLNEIISRIKTRGYNLVKVSKNIE